MTHRPAVFVALIFMGGILGYRFVGFGLLWGLLIFLPCLMLVCREKRKRRDVLVLGFVLLAGVFAAWARFLLPLNHILSRLDDLKGRDVNLVCQVASSVHLKTQGLAPSARFLCDVATIGGEAWQGKVLVHLFGAREGLGFGQKIFVRGKISRPYLASAKAPKDVRKGVRQDFDALLYVKKNAPCFVLPSKNKWWLWLAAATCREAFEAVFNKYLSPGEAGLMKAMLLGPRNDIPPFVYDVFRKTGTAHIIAISGMNMTLTAAGLMFILGVMHIPRAVRAWAAVVILGFYALMAGASAPVMRSAVMASVVIISFVLERETDALNNLALAAFLLLAVDPSQLEDVGFQLSFVCTASLIFLTPLILDPLKDIFKRLPAWGGFLVQSAAVTLAAFIGSAGILFYVFGCIAPVGLIVNLPVIPLMGVVTLLGFLLLGLGLLMPFLVLPIALVLKLVLNAATAVLIMASTAPMVEAKGVWLGWVYIYYAGLMMIIILASGFRPDSSRTFIDKPLPL